jgi:hypothetical protein
MQIYCVSDNYAVAAWRVRGIFRGKVDINMTKTILFEEKPE